MKSKASVAYETIRQNVFKNRVMGADETGVCINGKNNWAWTFQHKKATYISVHKNRGFNAIKEIMPEGLQNNILVTDCWPAYFKTGAANHQLCTAHLLRELTHFEEKYSDDTWVSRMSERAIRNFKVKQKISGFFKSDAGAEIYAMMSSIIDTAINNKQNPFEIVRLIAKC